MMKAIKEYVLNKSLAAHMNDPGRFDHGPAGSSLWGWLYFRVLARP